MAIPIPSLMRSMAVFATYMIYRCIFRFFQQLVWHLNGTRAKQMSYESGSDDRNAVHILNIVGRMKSDMITPSTESDFITSHHSFGDVRRLQAANVSLYTLTDTEAIFVETPPEVDIFTADATSFLYMAQFHNATKLLKVKHHSLHAAAALMGPMEEKFLFLCSTGRCGSTLLTRMVEATGNAFSLNEPDAFTSIANDLKPVSESTRMRLLASTTRMLCKHVKPDIKYFFIKPRPIANSLFPELQNLPNAKVMFMYRQGFPTLKSHYLVYSGTVLSHLMQCISAIPSEKVRLLACVAAVGGTGVPFARCRSELEIYFTMAGLSMQEYLRAREGGVHIPAVRYEHLVDRPQEALTAIFKYCGIPVDQVVKATAALNVDSQANSPLAKRLNAKFQHLAYTPEFKRICDRLSAELGIPKMDDNSDLPGTITGLE